MARKPDIFDEIILFLKENHLADTSLSAETAQELFADVVRTPVPQKEVPAAPAPAPVAPAPVSVPVTPAPAPAPVRCEIPDLSNMGWEELRAAVQQCGACELCQARNNTVFGEGPLDAPLMFIGEGPGADEDAQGRPFVGRAGELLTRMISAMGFDRTQNVYIANVVKCRPPNNRTPLPAEAEICRGYLLRQIELLKPKAIVLLGATPLLYLFNLKGITKLRGKWLDWNGIPVMPTYHPAFLLRDPNRKVETWQDLQMVMKLFGKTPPQRKA